MRLIKGTAKRNSGQARTRECYCCTNMRLGRFINAKQGESKAKCTLQQRGLQTQKAVLHWGSPRSQASIGICSNGDGQSWKTGLCVINSSHKLRECGFGWSDWGYYFLWAPESAGQQDPAICHKPFC
jgi:hypothetical protein